MTHPGDVDEGHQALGPVRIKEGNHPRGGQMRKGLALGVLTAILAVAVTTTAVAKTTASAKTCNVSVGLAAPVTGPAASIGQEQLHWAQVSLAAFNAAHKTSYKMVVGDTQLPNVAAAINIARQFASNNKIVGVAGPAGSQEVQAFGASMTRARMAYVSPSATRDDLTNGQRPTFFRVVGSDDTQGAVDARYAVRTLKVDKLVDINDGSSYSVGLAARFGNVAHILGASVDLDEITQQQTDFSSLVDKIGSDVDLVFLPWQIASQGQTFSQQMKAKGKNAIIFGSDGLFSSDFTIEGAYVSAFARDIHGIKGTAALIKAYEKKYGKFGTFGPPTYVSVQVVLDAIDRSCRAGAQVKKTNLKNTILGQGIRFDANGDVVGGVFFIYRIVNGKYQLVFPK
jgi:branched-chain amino acid transport system substrate-binding protein